MDRQTLEVVRGDTLVLSVPIVRDGAAVNITGATFRFTVRLAGAADPVLEATSAGGEIVISSPTGGLALVTIDAADTWYLQIVTYSWDVEMTESSGRVSTVALGWLTVLRDVSV